MCAFEKYFGEYIDGNLSPEKELEFLRHLQTCYSCPQRLEEVYFVHRRLKNINIPAPQAALLNEYQLQLESLFGKATRDSRWYRKLDRLAFNILPIPSAWWRYATAVILILSGIFIGRFFLQTDGQQQRLITNAPYLWEKPISSADIQYINYYLLASEMILLEIENMNPGDQDLLISEDTAQKLLMKTFMVHESALQLNDPHLLRFLSKMELILYELANSDESRNVEVIESIRMVVNNSHLLEEVRQLQKVIEETRKG